MPILMLLILIPIVWLAVLAFVVAMCQMAARGDAALVSATREARRERRATRRNVRPLRRGGGAGTDARRAALSLATRS